MYATTPDLPKNYRETFLDLILTWGSIDVSLGRFAAVFVDEENFFDAVDFLDKKSASSKLHEVVKLLKSVRETPAILDTIRNLKKSKKSLKKHSVVRNHIAHSKCIGLHPNDKTIVCFLKFERIGKEELAHYSVPFEEIERALAWGKNFDAFLAASVFATKNGIPEVAQL